MSASRRLRSAARFALGGVLAALLAASCGIEDGRCLRMSDCEAPFACVEGVCVSDQPTSGAPAAATDATGADAAATTAHPDAGSASDATADASSDATADAPADADASIDAAPDQ